MKWYYTLLFIATAFPPATSGGDIKLTSWPSIVIKEGETAEVPCLTSGEGDILMWRKGEFFNTSKYVISRADDNDAAREPTGYSISPRHGNLLIANVTFEDEGRYYCRIASDKNDCNVGVSVYVQDRHASIFLEECYPRRSCVILYTDESTSLTCKAQFVSGHTVLKWFDGSTELESRSIISTQNGSNSINISSTLTDTFEEDTYLQCFAVDERIGFIEGMSASGGLKSDGDMQVDQAVWAYILVPTLILLCISCFVIIVVLLKLRSKGEDNQIAKADGGEPEKEPMIASQSQLESNDTAATSQDSTSEKQRDELCQRISRLKKNVLKVDLGLLVRLQNKNKDSTKTKTWWETIFGENTAAEDSLKSLATDTFCTHISEHGPLKSDAIEKMMYLIENAVDGFNSCIILLFENESQKQISESLKSICERVFGKIQLLQSHGFHVVNKMKFTKLEETNLVSIGKIDVEPMTIASYQEADVFISDQFTDLSTVNAGLLDFHICSALSEHDTTNKMTGLLRLLVLKKSDYLQKSVIWDTSDKKTEDHVSWPIRLPGYKFFIVFNGNLDEDADKTRIKTITDKIKEFKTLIKS
ncbi:uncharacterized protein [Apostichopus japonicus]|uniref:uncharacterized protein isoform X2 n=1 Tax=Stichopus japonicus TaxID=307972 RepID=UPI003AB4ABA4